jgi:hypothetical protein
MGIRVRRFWVHLLGSWASRCTQNGEAPRRSGVDELVEALREMGPLPRLLPHERIAVIWVEESQCLAHIHRDTPRVRCHVGDRGGVAACPGRRRGCGGRRLPGRRVARDRELADRTDPELTSGERERAHQRLTRPGVVGGNRLEERSTRSAHATAHTMSSRLSSSLRVSGLSVLATT